MHQPAWRGVGLKTIMEERWGCGFGVDVDTNVAAVGEYAFGGRRVGRMLYLTLSTGMGGGFLVDGKIYRGADGGHPEVAHQGVNFRCSFPERVACECGAGDCLEALVSGNGIRRVYGKAAEEQSEGEWDEVTAAIRRCHEKLHEMGAVRVATNVRISTRTDKDQSRDDKIRSVREKMNLR